MDKSAAACKWERRMPAQSVCLKAEDIGCHREEGLKSWRAEIAVCAHEDPDDSVLRIAPTFPPVEELKIAVKVLTCAAKIATLEKMI